MKSKGWIVIPGFIVAAMFVLFMVTFIVNEGESTVVTTFGKPVRAIARPGLYARWPWPVQRVYRFDNRIQCLDGAFEQTLTKDGKSVMLSVYAGWKIHDPILFLERVGTPEEAEKNLNGLLSSYKNAVIGQYLFSHLVNIDTNILRFSHIENEILDAVRPEALERYSIDMDFLGIRRIGLPESITEKVFERMRAEREELAEKFRSEGEAESIRIRAEADSERDQTLAQAAAQGKRIQAEGDAKAAEYYAVFEQHPELAIFLRKLEVLEETTRNKATIILGPDSEPFDLLQGGATVPARK
ncbi:MAG: protease modulator HflC [Spartobacteria bacterium]|nr:protease modulator HflC [Spartobacteria bacterium]